MLGYCFRGSENSPCAKKKIPNTGTRTKTFHLPSKLAPYVYAIGYEWLRVVHCTVPSIECCRQGYLPPSLLAKLMNIITALTSNYPTVLVSLLDIYAAVMAVTNGRQRNATNAQIWEKYTRLELRWQLYVTSLPKRNIQNSRLLYFLFHGVHVWRKPRTNELSVVSMQHIHVTCEKNANW